MTQSEALPPLPPEVQAVLAELARLLQQPEVRHALYLEDTLGLSDAVGRAGWPLERIQIRDQAGGVLMDLDLRRFAATYGIPRAYGVRT